MLKKPSNISCLPQVFRRQIISQIYQIPTQWSYEWFEPINTYVNNSKSATALRSKRTSSLLLSVVAGFSALALKKEKKNSKTKEILSIHQ